MLLDVRLRSRRQDSRMSCMDSVDAPETRRSDVADCLNECAARCDLHPLADEGRFHLVMIISD